MKKRLKRYSQKSTEKENIKKMKNSTMKSLENNQDDNQKMYDAVRQINKMKPKIPLIVSSGDGQTTDEVEQSKIITSYFKTIFYKNADPIGQIQPTPIRTPFTRAEMRKAVSKLKPGKLPGCTRRNPATHFRYPQPNCFKR